MSRGDLQEMEVGTKQSRTAVNAGAKAADPMQHLSGSTPGQTGSWEDLGGPTPENYKVDDDSAKLKTPGTTLKQVRDVVNKGAAAADAMKAVKEEEVDKIKRNIKECNFWFRWYIDYILIYLFSYGKTGIKNQKSEILGNYVKWEDKRVYDGEIYSPTFKIMDIVPDRFHHDIEHKKENIRNELDHQIKQEYINAMRKGLNEFLFEIGLYHICDRDYLKEKLNKWEDRCSFEVEIGNRRPSLTIPIKFFEINKGNLFLSLEDLGIGKEEIDDDIYDLWFVQDFSLFDKIPKTNEDFRERYIQKYTEAVKEFYNYSKEKGWEWVKYYGESDPEKIKSDLEKEYYYKAPISDEYMNYLSQEIKKLSTPSVFPALKDLTVNMKKLMNTESENEFKNIFIELFIDRLLLSGTEPEFTYFL